MTTIHSNLQGSLSITCPRGGDTDYIEIALFDKSSGVEFATARIELASFAEALVGLAHVDCRFDLRAEMVGKRREHKEEIVPYKDGWVDYNERETVAREVLKSYEIDGWRGRADDLFNQHRHGQNGYRVTFVRYVDAEEGK